jgi:hypothetical protein
MNKFKIMTTRYSDLGINAISDVEIFKGYTTIKNEKKQIYHLRMDYNTSTSAWQTLEYFLINVLPNISNSFVLLITGEDVTIPNQLDPRWQNSEHLNLIKNVYNSIINSPLLLHCYIENRDELHEKTSSIPLGINPREMPNNNVDYIIKYMNNYQSMETRELKAICIHRDRYGDREIINKFKKNEWSDFVITDTGYCHDSWYKLLQTYPFIICAHGGGIDPSPKVWEALCVGCIPIIKHSTLDDIYKNFPVVFVDEFTSNTITLNNLKMWRNEYSKYYDTELRNEWIGKLYLNYWEDKIKSHLYNI